MCILDIVRTARQEKQKRKTWECESDVLKMIIIYNKYQVLPQASTHLASFQMVKAMRNAPGTHFNVCNKCSWLNTWHYGRSLPKTMGLPRHLWFSNLEEAANNSCQLTSWLFQLSASCPLCASLLKYCQWSHMGRLSICMGRCWWWSACGFCGISWWIGVWEFGLFIYF